MSKRLPRSSARQAFIVCRPGLVVTVVADSALDLGDGVACQLQRSRTVAAFVALGLLQFGACQAQMFERRLHVRLVGAGASSDESRGNGGDDEQGDDETMKLHGSSSYPLIDVR